MSKELRAYLKAAITLEEMFLKKEDKALAEYQEKEVKPLFATLTPREKAWLMLVPDRAHG